MKHPLGPGAAMPTTERLARAIEAELAKQWNRLDPTRRVIITLFARRAREGWFDDYKSPSPTPISDLIHVASHVEFDDIASRAKAGEFDATLAESDAWAESAEGVIALETFGSLFDQIRRTGYEIENIAWNGEK